jgi:hypothetical protein
MHLDSLDARNVASSESALNLMLMLPQNNPPCISLIHYILSFAKTIKPPSPSAPFIGSPLIIIATKIIKLSSQSVSATYNYYQHIFPMQFNTINIYSVELTFIIITSIVSTFTGSTSIIPTFFVLTVLLPTLN